MWRVDRARQPSHNVAIPFRNNHGEVRRALGIGFLDCVATIRRIRPAHRFRSPTPTRKSSGSRSSWPTASRSTSSPPIPLLAKPIQMNFDPQGRLWVVCSEVYPQIKPGQKANDKIIILEDNNGDGKADKTTVFADGSADPDGRRAGRRRRLRRQQHRTAPPERHRRRRQGRHAPRRSLGLRHRGHAPHSAHAALGARRPALLQPVDLHS